MMAYTSSDKDAKIVAESQKIFRVIKNIGTVTAVTLITLVAIVNIYNHSTFGETEVDRRARVAEEQMTQEGTTTGVSSNVRQNHPITVNPCEWQPFYVSGIDRILSSQVDTSTCLGIRIDGSDTYAICPAGKKPPDTCGISDVKEVPKVPSGEISKSEYTSFEGKPIEVLVTLIRN